MDRLLVAEKYRISTIRRSLAASNRRRVMSTSLSDPRAARGPDFEIFAALAGGALVLTRRARADATMLRQLRGALMRCGAQLVTTVVRED